MLQNSNHFNDFGEAILRNKTSGRIELFLLSIFKWIVVFAMLILMVAILYLVSFGVVNMSERPVAKPEPAKLASKPSVSDVAFLSSIKPKATEEVIGKSNGGSASLLAVDTAEEMFRSQAERLWVHVEKYQAACGLAAPLSKKEFTESLRETPLKTILERRGNDFSASQIAFVKDTLGNGEIVKLCMSGRTGLFFSALEFHRSNWDQQVQAATAYEAQERSRVAASVEAETSKAAERKAASNQAFVSAAVAFGLFMCVALVLIFARIESNLRGVRSVS